MKVNYRIKISILELYSVSDWIHEQVNLKGDLDEEKITHNIWYMYYTYSM